MADTLASAEYRRQLTGPLAERAFAAVAGVLVLQAAAGTVWFGPRATDRAQ